MSPLINDPRDEKMIKFILSKIPKASSKEKLDEGIQKSFFTHQNTDYGVK